MARGFKRKGFHPNGKKKVGKAPVTPKQSPVQQNLGPSSIKADGARPSGGNSSNVNLNSQSEPMVVVPKPVKPKPEQKRKSKGERKKLAAQKKVNKQKTKERRKAGRKQYSSTAGPQPYRSPNAGLDELNQIDPTRGKLGAIKGTASTLFNSGADYLGRDGNLKKAGIGVLQSSAVSAAGHGALAAAQGDDPWEAAKTGALRGAVVGAGYQGMKAATQLDKHQGYFNNLKHMGRNVYDVGRAHTVSGNSAIRKEGVSKPLENILRANQLNSMNRQKNKLQ